MIYATTVTKVFKSDKNKDGKAFIDKNGKPFWKVACQFGHPDLVDKWYSCLVYNQERQREYQINNGDEVKIMVTQNGEFYNFKIASQNDLVLVRLDTLEKTVAQLVKAHNDKIHPLGNDYPEPEDIGIKPEDIPF